MKMTDLITSHRTHISPYELNMAALSKGYMIWEQMVTAAQQ
jgi:hypothetical protein